MIYEQRPDGRVLGFHEHEGIRVTLVAKDVRRQRTGIHAWVGIKIGALRPVHSNMNIDRDEDRTRLANSMHRQLDESVQKILPGNVIKGALDDFAYGLWDQVLGQIVVEPVSGKRAPKRFMMRPYFLESAGVIMFAPPGSAKSWTALGIAITIDHGLADSPYGEPVGRFPALYINLERSKDSLAQRLADVNLALGLPEDRPLAMVNGRGKSFSDVIEQAQQFVAQNGVRFVVLDSLSRAGYGDLSGNEEMNRAMDGLNSLGTAWLAIGHTPRTDKTHSYGSVMADAAADVMLKLDNLKDKQTGKIVVELEVTKANDISWPTKRYIAYEFGDETLTTIRRSTAAEYVSLDVSETGGDSISDVLSDGPKTATQIAEELGMNRSYVARKLNESGFHKERLGKEVYFSLSENVLPGNTLPVTREVGGRALPVAQNATGNTSTRQDFTCYLCHRGADRWTLEDDPRPVCLACMDEQERSNSNA